MEEMTLEMAEKCFHNALIILEDTLREFKKKEPEKLLSNDSMKISFIKLQTAVINVTLKLAYVSLSLDNPLITISHCQTILDFATVWTANIEPRTTFHVCPVEYLATAVCYLYEALAMTDQPDKIFYNFLPPQRLQNLLNNLLIQTGDDSLQQMLLLNLAVAHIVQNSFAGAQTALDFFKNTHGENLTPRVKPYFHLVQLYLLIVQGKNKQALEYIGTINV